MYGIRVHIDLKAVVILASTEWASQQMWGIEISVADGKIVAKYRFNHTHDTDSIKEIIRILAVVDEAKNRRKAKTLGELADMVSQGMTRLQQLVQQLPAQRKYLSDSSDKSANASTTTDSEVSSVRQGRAKKKERRPRLAKHVRR